MSVQTDVTKPVTVRTRPPTVPQAERALATEAASGRTLRIVAALTRLSLGWIFVWAFFDKLLGLGHETGASDALSELSHENVRERTAEALADLLSALAEQRPLLVVLDDLHWADAATLALVEDLLELTDQASVGIAMLYRSERESAAWGVGERAKETTPAQVLAYAECAAELHRLAAGEERASLAGLRDLTLPPPKARASRACCDRCAYFSWMIRRVDSACQNQACTAGSSAGGFGCIRWCMAPQP